MGKMKEIYTMYSEGMSIEEISKETQIEERVLKKLFWRYDKKRTMYDMVNENEWMENKKKWDGYKFCSKTAQTRTSYR